MISAQQKHNIVLFLLPLLLLGSYYPMLPAMNNYCLSLNWVTDSLRDSDVLFIVIWLWIQRTFNVENWKLKIIGWKNRIWRIFCFPNDFVEFVNTEDVRIYLSWRLSTQMTIICSTKTTEKQLRMFTGHFGNDMIEKVKITKKSWRMSVVPLGGSLEHFFINYFLFGHLLLCGDSKSETKTAEGRFYETP